MSTSALFKRMRGYSRGPQPSYRTRDRTVPPVPHESWHCGGPRSARGGLDFRGRAPGRWPAFRRLRSARGLGGGSSHRHSLCCNRTHGLLKLREIWPPSRGPGRGQERCPSSSHRRRETLAARGPGRSGPRSVRKPSADPEALVPEASGVRALWIARSVPPTSPYSELDSREPGPTHPRAPPAEPGTGSATDPRPPRSSWHSSELDDGPPGPHTPRVDGPCRPETPPLQAVPAPPRRFPLADRHPRTHHPR